MESFDDLLAASRAQPEPQRLLLVFARAARPPDATQAERPASNAVQLADGGAGGADHVHRTGVARHQRRERGRVERARRLDRAGDAVGLPAAACAACVGVAEAAGGATDEREG